MEQPDMYRKMTNLYSNPTKMSILLMLSEYGKMTVTQMSKYVDVTRANLYHSVSQMVNDGFLNEPEVKLKKNYVEKYYTINEEVFGSFDPRAWEEHLAKLTVQELRIMLSTSMAGQSLLLKMASERIADAEPEQIEHIREMFIKGRAWMSYSVMSRKSTEKVSEYINKIIEVLSTSEPDANASRADRELTRLLIVFLPLIGGEKY